MCWKLTNGFLATRILILVVVLCVQQYMAVEHVTCETTKGTIGIEVREEWAPLGAQRFLELVDDNFFTDIAFFR